MFLAKVRVFSYENDFGNHESVNQAGDIIEIRVVELVEQEHFVRRNGAKEKRQIYRNRDKLLKLMDGLLL
jgi:ribosomal protein S24E